MLCISLIVLVLAAICSCTIDREAVVRKFNPHRDASSNSTPIQVGNGNFAFGADVTGLQTFLPFNTLSSWCWHNSSLPYTPGQTSPEDFTGLDWWTHGRLVNYAQPNPAEAKISQWLIGNPHRVNLARIGLLFYGYNISEADLEDRSQDLDLFSGMLYSNFSLHGHQVQVRTVSDPHTDTVAFSIESNLIEQGALSVLFDYPYAVDSNKFEAPFVGLFNVTAKHTTTVSGSSDNSAIIRHDIDATTYHNYIGWHGRASLSHVSGHRYILQPRESYHLKFIGSFAPDISVGHIKSFHEVESNAARWWSSYWLKGAFVDMTKSNTPQATELQRRVILSQYWLAVNYAGNDPPQESGLTNNGWYGKFHLEMFLWHSAHWALWNRWDIQRRNTDVYQRFLQTSVQRAREQGYEGARWGKMSDPTGRSAPGEINSLLIWQQPHPSYLAELEYQAFPTNVTLQKWDEVLTATADFMASFAFWNESTMVYDLGPPVYPLSEDTNPNMTVNPTFELAYWRFGLDVASRWRQRQGKSIPKPWTHVLENLAPLPVNNRTYVTYEGVPDMWNNPDLTFDHPGLLGIYGLLPPSSAVNSIIFQNTVERVHEKWNLTTGYGWDFPLQAIAAARQGYAQAAVDFLTHPNFQFDDIGMPVGGVRVATPYFPASGSLLFAIAGMAAGWKSHSPGVGVWPEGWVVECEGFIQPL